MKIKFINQNANKYFDFTASGLCVENIESEMKLLMTHYANTHSVVGALSSFMNNMWESSRVSLFRSLEIDPREFEIIPTGFGSTAAIKKFQELIGIYIPPKTKTRCKVVSNDIPVMFIGPYEHHSNDISYRESIADTVRLTLDDEGNLDIKDLILKLQANQGREMYVCLAVASNVTGIITDIETVSTICRRYGAHLCLDAATSSPYMNVPHKMFDVMFMSPHKTIGGPGSVGLLVIRKSLVDMSLPPTFAGGGTVSYVNSESQYYVDDLHNRELAGTPGILQFIRTAKAYELRNAYGLDKIRSEKKALHRYLVSELKNLEGVTIYGNMNTENIGICSLNVDGWSPYDLCDALSRDYGIETRAGCSCAGPYGHVLLGLEINQDLSPDVGWLRISVHYTHTKADIDYLLESIKAIIYQ